MSRALHLLSIATTIGKRISGSAKPLICLVHADHFTNKCLEVWYWVVQYTFQSVPNWSLLKCWRKCLLHFACSFSKSAGLESFRQPVWESYLGGNSRERVEKMPLFHLPACCKTKEGKSSLGKGAVLKASKWKKLGYWVLVKGDYFIFLFIPYHSSVQLSPLVFSF